MKKSTFWFLLAIFWAVDAAIAIVRFFDIHIVIQGKEGKLIKEISREGDRVTPPRVAVAALSVVLSHLYCVMSFKARKAEKLAAIDCQLAMDDGE